MKSILNHGLTLFKYMSCTLMFVTSFPVMSSNNAVANDYQSLSIQYDDFYKKGQYKEAFEISIKQLDMDPSDSVAFLRLAL